MLFLIIVAAIILLGGLFILATGKNKDIKQVSAILEKTIGQTPDYNKSFLAGQKKPQFSYKDDQLNFQSNGEKFQRFDAILEKRNIQITLFYDEQKRCQNYLIKKYSPETAYNRVYEEFWREDVK